MRVLWVGNSYTYLPTALGGIPGTVSLLAELEAEPDILEHATVVQGGVSLVELAARFEEAARAEPPGGFDAVVLQEQSLTPAGGVWGPHPRPYAAREASEEALRRCYAPVLRDLQQQHGTRVLLYQTWGRPAKMHGQPEVLGDFEDMSRRLAEGYEHYARALAEEGVVAPETVACGEAYVRLGRSASAPLLPSLYADAIGHPTPLAALLVAAVFARALWRRGLRAGVAAAAARRLGLESAEVGAAFEGAGLLEEESETGRP